MYSEHMSFLRQYKLPFLVFAAFGIFGGFFYFQAGRETSQYASASYLTNGQLVSIYTQRGEFKKALSLIDQMQAEHPDDPAVYYNAAVLYAAMDDLSAARVSLAAGLAYVKDTALEQRFADFLESIK